MFAKLTKASSLSKTTITKKVNDKIFYLKISKQAQSQLVLSATLTENVGAVSKCN